MDLSKSNIGIGFSSESEKFTYLKCINTETIGISFASSANMDFAYQGMDSFSEGLHLWEMEGSVTVLPRVKIGMWGRSMSYSQESKYSKSFIYSYQANLAVITMKQSKYGYDALNDLGKNIYSNNYRNFKNICGDKFITQQILGSKLYIKITFNARTLQDKRELDLAIYGKVDLFIVVAKLQQQVGVHTEEKSINYEVNIAALQIGGDPTKLASILKEKDGKYIISCNSQELESCVSALKTLIEYSKGDYVEQINIEDHEQLLTKASVVDTIYGDYKDLGIEYDTNFAAIEKAKERLSEMYYKMLEDKEFINHILHRSNSDNQTNDQEEVSKYKEFDVDLIQFIDKLDVTGLRRELSHNYWQWDGTMLFVREKLTFEKLFDNIENWLQDIEKANRECYLDIDKCNDFIDELVASSIWQGYNWEVDIFAKAYQVIAVCDNQVYLKYLLPVTKNTNGVVVYQENSKYDDLNTGESSYYNTVYGIENKELFILDHFLLKHIHCSELIEQTDTISYELYGMIHDMDCINAICPNHDAQNLYVLLNQVENPI